MRAEEMADLVKKFKEKQENRRLERISEQIRFHLDGFKSVALEGESEYVFWNTEMEPETRKALSDLGYYFEIPCGKYTGTILLEKPSSEKTNSEKNLFLRDCLAYEEGILHCQISLSQ